MHPNDSAGCPSAAVRTHPEGTRSTWKPPGPLQDGGSCPHRPGRQPGRKPAGHWRAWGCPGMPTPRPLPWPLRESSGALPPCSAGREASPVPPNSALPPELAWLRQKQGPSGWRRRCVSWYSGSGCALRSLPLPISPNPPTHPFTHCSGPSGWQHFTEGDGAAALSPWLLRVGGLIHLAPSLVSMGQPPHPWALAPGQAPGLWKGKLQPRGA